MTMICVRTYTTEQEAAAAVGVLTVARIEATHDWSDFVERWCVRVQEPDARAAYVRLGPPEVNC